LFSVLWFISGAKKSFLWISFIAYFANSRTLGGGDLLTITPNVKSMKVMYECELIARCPVVFAGKDGEKVEYNEFYFLNVEEGVPSVFQINSKISTSAKKGDLCVVGVDIDPQSKKKTKLVSVDVQKSL